MFPLVPDLPRVLLALLLFAGVAVLPGWAAAMSFNLLGFRQRFFTMRLAIATCTSFGIGPIIVVLLSRWAGMRAAVAAIAVLAILGAIALAADLKRRRRPRAGASRIVRATIIAGL